MPDEGWKHKISHHAQLGGIETSVLDSGLGKGTRIAWVNTGTGLRYKLVLDRAMDITDALYNQFNLVWLSHAGIVRPGRFPDGGIEWLRGFAGGLMTTCGLDHVGGPETDQYGERGLHSRISNIPAEIESILQPDPVNGIMDMSITGRMRQFQVLGENLELKRTISGTLGKSVIKISDEVFNRGNSPAAHMLLYHFNFGWPLVDEGTAINWNGKWYSREEPDKRKIFLEGNDFRSCRAPMDEHAGAGEEAAFIDPEPDQQGICTCGLRNDRIGIELVLKFPKKQLPWLTNWQHWAKGEYVTGLEPGTHPPIGQARARKEGTLIFIEPGESRKYQMELELIQNRTI